jgi:hypothetical protein
MNSFIEPLILKAFEATGIWPQDAKVILKGWDSGNDSDGSDGAEGSDKSGLSTRIKINRRLHEVVRDIHNPRAQQLAQAIHHTIVQHDIVNHPNQELEVAVGRKRQRQTPRKTLQLEAIEEPDEYPGCAVWWSPSRIQRHRDRIGQERLDQEAQDQIKADERATQISNRKLKARLVAERMVAAAANRMKKQKEKAAATAPRIYKRN